jgi:hypothetical protein
MRQETLEEAFKLFKEKYPILTSYNLHHLLQVARFGAKWQQEQDQQEIQDLKNRLDIVRESSTKAIKMIEDLEVALRYGEEEVRKISLDFFYHWWNAKGTNTEQGFDDWFEQFKKSDCQHQFIRTGDSFDLTTYCKKCGVNI